MEAFPFLFMLIFFAAVLIAGQAAKADQSRKLSAFVRSLEGGRGQTEQGLFDSLASTWVNGNLHGRPISLDFERRGSGKHKYTVARYAVEVDNAAGDFELAKGNAFDWLGSLVGLVERPDVHPDLGTNVVLRGAPSAASRRLLQQGELAAKLRGLLDDGFTVVRLARGRLTVERRVDGRSLDLAQMNAVYARLGEIADLCGRRKVTVKVKGLSVKPRFAWTAGGSTSLCPYCRDEVRVDGASDDLAACDRCGTLHHRACFDEAGGCTIFGCGQRAGRARDRA